MPVTGETAFVSYSRDDSEFALRLARDLKGAGARVWLDQLEIQPGERSARAVEKALTDAPRMLVILSPAAVSSTHVEDEFGYAIDEGKTVIPVYYRECAIPFRLRNFQYADFRRDYASGLANLLAALGLSEPTTKSPAATYPMRRGNDGGKRVADEKGVPNQSASLPPALRTDDLRKELYRPLASPKPSRQQRLAEEKKKPASADKLLRVSSPFPAHVTSSETYARFKEDAAARAAKSK